MLVCTEDVQGVARHNPLFLLLHRCQVIIFVQLVMANPGSNQKKGIKDCTCQTPGSSIEMDAKILNLTMQPEHHKKANQKLERSADNL